MKLKNKLLPLVGIGAACAAVTPIALTSCKGSGMVDLVGNYSSQISDIPGVASYNEEDATKLYFETVKNNPTIFADDLYWCRNMTNKIVYSNENALSGDSTEHAKFEGAGSITTDIAEGEAGESGGEMNWNQQVTVPELANVVELTSNSVEANSNGESNAGSYIGESIDNVLIDNEKITLNKLENKVINIETGRKKLSFKVWLASFVEEFDIMYDESTRILNSSDLTEASSTNATITQNGKIEFVNIPLNIRFSYGSTTRFEDLEGGFETTSSLEEGLWSLGLDDTMYYDEDEEEWVFLIDYMLTDSEIGSSINFDIKTSQKTTVIAKSGGTRVDDFSREIKFTLNEDLSFTEGFYIKAYGSVYSYIANLGFSHYLWNTSEK